MPHTHSLIKLERTLGLEDIDKYITTAIPPESDPELRELVLTHMVSPYFSAQQIS